MGMTSEENTALYVVGWDVFRRRRVRPVLPAGSFEAKLQRVELRQAREALGVFEGVVSGVEGMLGLPGIGPPTAVEAVESYAISFYAVNNVANPGPGLRQFDEAVLVGQSPVAGVVRRMEYLRVPSALNFRGFALRAASGGTFFSTLSNRSAPPIASESFVPDFRDTTDDNSVLNPPSHVVEGAMPVTAGDNLFIVFRSVFPFLVGDGWISGVLTIETGGAARRRPPARGGAFDRETVETARRTRPPAVEREPGPTPDAPPGDLVATRDIVLEESWEFPYRENIRALDMPVGYRLMSGGTAAGPPVSYTRGQAIDEFPRPPRDGWQFTGYRQAPLVSGLFAPGTGPATSV